MVNRWKHPNFTLHFLGWLQGWCELGDGLVTVLSFGCYSSAFELRMSSYRARVYINILKRKRKELA